MNDSYEYEDIDVSEPIYGFENPPESFLRECEEYWANFIKPFYRTVERRIGNTTYTVETEFAGKETLANKLHRMFMGETEK